jgi:hypothetical protein
MNELMKNGKKPEYYYLCFLCLRIDFMKMTTKTRIEKLKKKFSSF